MHKSIATTSKLLYGIPQHQIHGEYKIAGKYMMAAVAIAQKSAKISRLPISGASICMGLIALLTLYMTILLTCSWAFAPGDARALGISASTAFAMSMVFCGLFSVCCYVESKNVLGVK